MDGVLGALIMLIGVLLGWFLRQYSEVNHDVEVSQYQQVIGQMQNALESVHDFPEEEL